jgi:hypothetical protein
MNSTLDDSKENLIRSSWEWVSEHRPRRSANSTRYEFLVAVIISVRPIRSIRVAIRAIAIGGITVAIEAVTAKTAAREPVTAEAAAMRKPTASEMAAAATYERTATTMTSTATTGKSGIGSSDCGETDGKRGSRRDHPFGCKHFHLLSVLGAIKTSANHFFGDKKQ